MQYRNLILIAVALILGTTAFAEPLELFSRDRVEQPDGSFNFKYETVHWDPAKTAIIVCDMWDTMRDPVVAGRVAELAPRVNETIAEARDRGVLIVHAPSGTMDFYAGTPQRQRVLDAPKAEPPVPLQWNDRDEDREPPLPIDDSDGGWEGPVTEGPPPQSRQHPAIEIAAEDAIGEGAEIYHLLEHRGIENVILLGVHTNMCVLGRPFGIRQMTYLGKNVMLMRDLTDSLYNPEMPPQVSHVRGTELVIEHIEKYWCPTFTSRDLLNKPAFRFKQDERPRVVFIVSDDHYDADKTLPPFAQMLREDHGMDAVVLHGQGEADIPGMSELQAADCAVVYVRRLGLPEDQMDALKTYVENGGPIVGLRTASHAFTMNYKDPPGFEVPEGRAEWREFDAEILGGNYHNHAPNSLGTDVTYVKEHGDHPVLEGIDLEPWHSTGSLYYTSPVADDATVLMMGATPDDEEPLTWVREGVPGRVFYSGLGHPEDFEAPQFRRLLVNGIEWAAGQESMVSLRVIAPDDVGRIHILDWLPKVIVRLVRTPIARHDNPRMRDRITYVLLGLDAGKPKRYRPPAARIEPRSRIGAPCRKPTAHLQG